MSAEGLMGPFALNDPAAGYDRSVVHQRYFWLNGGLASRYLGKESGGGYCSPGYG